MFGCGSIYKGVVVENIFFSFFWNIIFGVEFGRIGDIFLMLVLDMYVYY